MTIVRLACALICLALGSFSSSAFGQTGDYFLPENEPFADTSFESSEMLSAQSASIALRLEEAVNELELSLETMAVPASTGFDAWEDMQDWPLQGADVQGPSNSLALQQSMAAAIESMSLADDVEIYQVPDGILISPPRPGTVGATRSPEDYLYLPDMMTGQLNLPASIARGQVSRYCPEQPSRARQTPRGLPEDFKVRQSHFGIYNANPGRLWIGVELDDNKMALMFEPGEFLTFQLPSGGKAVGAIITKGKGEIRQNFDGGSIYGVRQMINNVLGFWELKNGNQ